MTLLQLAAKHGIPVDWTMLLLAWEGSGTGDGHVSTDEVIAYAGEQLNACDGPDFEKVLALADDDASDRVRFHQRLAELASTDDTARLLAARKWRFILLAEYLEGVDETCEDASQALYTSIDLGEFRQSFSYPDDSPFAELNATKVPQDTLDWEVSFREVISTHRRWLAHESQLIRQGPR